MSLSAGTKRGATKRGKRQIPAKTGSVFKLSSGYYSSSILNFSLFLLAQPFYLYLNKCFSLTAKIQNFSSNPHCGLCVKKLCLFLNLFLKLVSVSKMIDRYNSGLGLLQAWIAQINVEKRVVLSDGSLGAVQQREGHGPMRWESRGGAREWTDSP
ncbi:hypothetical protein ATANTOWER_000551 [Ataeniobius toweri]|uniref:Uncharacterized protein n=1 Tax=Ataeniobius toweri TaxID=208326 RepID=A0ABU7B4P1_9TELE|nr:hypothetical protein [Ataeniobius toweri]